MSQEYTGYKSSINRRQSVWVERLLVLIFLVSLLIGLGALAAFFLLRDTTPAPSTEPLEIAAGGALLPGLTLRELAGADPDGLILQAEAAGQLDTAAATLFFDVTLPPAVRAARAASLARGYVARNNAAAALPLWHMVLATGVLDSELSSLERGQLLAQAATGYKGAGDAESALTAARQALLVAGLAPDLLPAERVQILSAIEALAPTLPDPDFSRAVRDLMRNPFVTPGGLLAVGQPPTLAQGVPYDDALLAAIQNRQQTALVLADRIVLIGNESDIEPEREALRQALLAEDAARAQFHNRTGISLGEQTWLLLDRWNWLLERVRVGMNGYGISLVPEWESNLPFLRNELNGIYAALQQVCDAHAVAEATPAGTLALRLGCQQWLALQQARGLYPAARIDELADRLRAVQVEAEQAGTPFALPVNWDSAASPPGVYFRRP